MSYFVDCWGFDDSRNLRRYDDFEPEKIKRFQVSEIKTWTQQTSDLRVKHLKENS